MPGLALNSSASCLRLLSGWDYLHDYRTWFPNNLTFLTSVSPF
jgi:hypothetical protein